MEAEITLEATEVVEAPAVVPGIALDLAPETAETEPEMAADGAVVMAVDEELPEVAATTALEIEVAPEPTAEAALESRDGPDEDTIKVLAPPPARKAPTAPSLVANQPF